MRRLLSAIGAFFNPPPFNLGDVVEFRPDARALGWTQDAEGLYPGYIGTVTRIARGKGFEWAVYLDGKTVGFLSVFFRRVEHRPETESS